MSSPDPAVPQLTAVIRADFLGFGEPDSSPAGHTRTYMMCAWCGRLIGARWEKNKLGTDPLEQLAGIYPRIVFYSAISCACDKRGQQKPRFSAETVRQILAAL